MERKLVLAFPTIPSIGPAPDLEFPVKVGQLIDGIGAADLFVGRFPEPRKPLFEQLEHHSTKVRGGRFSLVTGSPRSSLL
jgi:hypothetical protein